jgi:GNAT superfamily N-acetyltransferase
MAATCNRWLLPDMVEDSAVLRERYEVDSSWRPQIPSFSRTKAKMASASLSADWTVEQVRLEARAIALAILFAKLSAVDQHRLIAESIHRMDRQPPETWGLFWARNGDLAGSVAMAIEMPGRTASFFPPPCYPMAYDVAKHRDSRTLVALGPISLADDLPLRVVQRLDQWLIDQRIAFSQCLLEQPSPELASLLMRAGYQRLCDLELMVSLRETWPDDYTSAARLQFAPAAKYDASKLAEIVEATYAGSLDCPAMDGWRTIEDCLSGYAATGDSATDHWWVIESDNVPCGVVLATEHRATRQWELMYVALVPQFRGRGLARHALEFLHSQARDAGADSIYLSVDANNAPAIRIYTTLSYQHLAQRTIFAKRIVLSGKLH